MKVLNKKTIRFASLVKSFGKPFIATFWSDPEKDAHFNKAVEENRVMTIKQFNVGSQKDYGLIGFFKEKQASYMVFPKHLSYEAGTKVVGINYDLIRQEKVKDPVKPGELKPERKKISEELGETEAEELPHRKSGRSHKKTSIDEAPPLEQEEAESKYKVVVRYTATQDFHFVLTAGSESKAKAQAIRLAEEKGVNFEKMSVKREVIEVKEDS